MSILRIAAALLFGVLLPVQLPAQTQQPQPGALSEVDRLLRTAAEHFMAARYEQAVEPYKEALRFQPDSLLARNNLGVCYLMLGSSLKAIEEFKLAVLLRPNIAETRFNLAIAYFGGARNQDALEESERILQMKPDWIHAQILNGLAHGRLRKRPSDCGLEPGTRAKAKRRCDSLSPWQRPYHDQELQGGDRSFPTDCSRSTGIG